MTELEERVLYSVAPADGAALLPDQIPDAALMSAAQDGFGATTQTVDVGLAIHDASSDDGSAAASLVSDGSSLTDQLDATLLANAPDDSTVSHLTHELVFVDANIEHQDQLLQSLGAVGDPSRQIEVVVLSPDRDGIAQISEALAAHDDLDAVHIISHGTDGAVKLGATWLHSGNLDAHAGTIALWHDALTSDADILIYGCDLAASDHGRMLLDGLHALTGADIAASVDATGHASLDGDWDLEYSVGAVETHVAVSTEFQESWLGLMQPSTTGTAIWRQNSSTTPEYGYWDGVSFDGSTNSANVGSWRVMDGAEAPTRDEIIVVGVDNSNVISGEIWNGSTWLALPFNNLATVSDSTFSGFAVDYESQSGDGMLVWNNGTTGTTGLSYRVWNGTAWSAEQTITTPLSGEPMHMKLASSAVRDEMALIVCGQNPADDYALVWNGSSWGNSVVLDTTTGIDRTEINVVYESQSGDALMVYDADASGNSVAYRTWNGTTWSVQNSVAAPAGVGAGSDFNWALLAADPNSDRLALGVVTDPNEIWFAVWDGSVWGSTVTATTSSAAPTVPNAAVAFESNTGDLLAAYGENNNSVRYRTWTSGGGWSSQLVGPNIGADPNSMTLDADPNTNQIMLSVQDDSSDLNYVVWNGASWGSPHEQETNTGETANQPFLYLFDQGTHVDMSSNALWLSTTGNDATPGMPGVNSVDEGEALRFGDPTLAFEPGTTSGTFSHVFNLDDYAGDSDANLDALHFVSRAITLGSGGNTLNLQPGDVLFSTFDDETLTSTNSLSILDDEVILYRPDTAGDYNSGTFTVVLDNFGAIHGGNDTWSLALVEQDTLVGDVTLAAGSFLFSRDGGAEDNDIRLFTPTGVGAGGTAGSVSVLIEGSEINIAAKVYGLELVEESLTIGDVTLPTGVILVNLDADDASTGSNNIATTQHDVFYLTVTQTTLGSGSAVANATMFFQGTDVGVDSGAESLDALAIFNLNTAPVLADTTVTLASVAEDAGAPVGAVGTLISDVADLITGGGQNNVTDPDSDAVTGIAIIAADTTDGTWHYSTNGGTNWNALGAVAGNSARLLAADASTRVYFEPNANYNGTLPSAITFRAWDQAWGTNGDLADTSGNGGATEFSLATDIASLTVSAVNDAPIISSNGGGATASLNVAENATAVTTVTSTDIDGGTPNYSIAGGADAALFSINSSSGDLTFVSGRNREVATDADSDHVYEVTVQVSDGAGGTETQAISVTIDDVDEFNVGAVTDTNATANAVDENAAIGTVVGITASASDADATTNAISYSLQDNDGGRFTIHATTGVVTLAGAIDREVDGASRNITVRATSADSSFTDQVFVISLNDLDEFNVGAVSDSDATANAVDENASVGTVVGMTASASDADATTNTISYSLQDDDGGRFSINSSTGVVTVAGAIDREADGSSRNITVRATSADLSFTDQVFVISINDLDEFNVGAVSDSDATSNAVAENASVGTVVGMTSSASDADATTNTITYSLDDSAGGRFAINGSTGVVTVADGTLLNREAAASHNVTVRATSSDTSFSTAVFTINLNDVDEFDVGAVSDSNAAANAVNENAANGTTVGVTASASDADATTNTITYSLDFSAGGRFAINGSTGVVTVADGTLLDREAAASHNIVVRATSDDGSFGTQNFTISLNPLNDNNPVITSNGAGATASINVAENSTTVTTITAMDADLPAQMVSYSITGGADAAKFTINGSTGVLSFVSSPNYESPTDVGGNNVYEVTVQASDGAGLTDTQALSVTVTDLRVDIGSQSTASTTSSSLILSHTTAGDNRLMLVAVSMGNPNGESVSGLTYNGDALAFVGIRTYYEDSDSEAQVELWQLVAPDLGTHNVVISLSGASSGGTVAGVMTFIGVDQASPLGAFASAGGDSSNPTVNVSSGADELVFAAITVESGDNYSLSPGAGQTEHWDLHTDNANSGASTEAGAASVTMSWTFGDSNQWVVGGVSIKPTQPTNTPPTVTSNGGGDTANINVAENATAVTTVTASDADLPSQTLTYGIAGGDDAAKFTINSTTGVLSFVAAPDRELPTDADGDNNYEVTVQVSDGIGGGDTQGITFTVTDVDEFDTSAISDTDAAVNALDENAANGTVVGIIAFASDADATTNTITYALDISAGGRFAIDGSTGVVTVADGTLLNREAAASHGITVRATSSDGSFSTQAFTIGLNDLDEFDVTAVSDSNATANAVNENAANGTVVGVTAAASDVDATMNAITYSLDDSAGGRFAINGSTGVVTVADGTLLDHETTASHTITVRATGADTSFSIQAFTINVNPLNDNNPVITSNGSGATAAVSIAENTTAVTTVTATDADLPAQMLTYSISGGADAASFTINSSTGALSFASAPDFESPTDAGGNNVYDVTVQASDGTLTDTQAIAVTVTAINEAPLNVVPGSQSTNEDVTLVFSSGTGNQIAISDVDVGAGAMQVTLTSTNGTLSLNGTSGLTFSVGDGTSDATMTFTGTIADINTVLNGLSFAPTANFNGAASLAITTNDQGNSGSGGALSDTDTVSITVNAVNDAPVNSLTLLQSTNLNTSLLLSSVNGNLISINDLEAGSNPVRVTLTETNGRLTLSSTTGLTFSTGDGTSDATMTFTGTQANINAALDGLLFAPTTGFTGTSTLQVTTNDQGNTGAGGAQSTTDSVMIEVVVEDRVNTTIAGSQVDPSVAIDADGDHVVVWTSDNQDGSGNGIYAQRYDATGAAVGGEFRVNTTTANDQVRSAVAMDSNGNFVVTWASKDQDGDNYGVYAQRFNASGVAQGGEFLVNVTTNGQQDQPAAAMDANGNFVIAWKSNSGGTSNDIYARRYDSSGVAQGGEFHVNTNVTNTQDQPAVAMDVNGDFVVTWKSNSKTDGSGKGVFAQRYDSVGVAQGGEFQVNTTSSGDQEKPTVAMATNGDFVIAWKSGQNQDGDKGGIFAQRFNAAGVAQGSEFRVNTTTVENQDWPTIGIDGTGAFTIAWASKDQDGSGKGIFAQRYLANGTTSDGEFRVNSTISNDQDAPALAMSSIGDLIVAWQGNGAGDTSGVFDQYYRSINDAPQNSVPGVQATNEDTALVFSSGNGNTLSISDVDALSTSLQVILSVTNGTLTLSGTSGLTFSSGDGTGDATMTFSGTTSSINTALNGLSFAPTTNFNGAASLSIVTNDQGNSGAGGALSDTDVVTIAVNEINDAPVATDDTATTNEDTPVNGNVLTNDTDIDNTDGIPGNEDTHTAVLDAGPTNGALTLNADGSFTYTPNANFFGTDSFSYHAVDSDAAPSNVATVTISVNEINDAPVATDDTATTIEDTPVSGNVLSNDTDIDNSDGILGNEDTHTAVLDAGPLNGSLLLNADGSFTYTPDANFFGSDSYTYHAVDSDGAASNVATVTITVNEINDAPVANDDSATTNEDTPVSGNVLNNDTDIDNTDGIPGNEDTRTAVLDAGPSNGSLLLNADGSFTYTPDANFFGSDSFTYHAVDSDGAASNVATVTITVNEINDAPVATDDTATTNEDTPASGNVLTNDTDIDNTDGIPGNEDTHTAVLDAGPSNGSLTLNADGSFTYTPNANFFGTDSFTYHAVDSDSAASNMATVTITVNEINDAPVATDDTATTNEDTPVSGNVLTNDTDIDNTDGIPGNEDTHTAVLDAGPANGLLTLNADGSFTYTPNANFFGSDSFTYHAVDSDAAPSNVATVTITVNEVNDAPVASDDTATTNEDAPVSGNVLTNDTDIDNSDGILGNEDTHTAVLDAGPLNGSLLLNADGSFTYTPNANFFGTDSFTYHAVDSDSAASNMATVTITVNEINDAPVATDDTATTNEDTPVNGNVLTNDTDIDNTDGILGNEDTHTAVLDAGPSNGSLLLNTDGSFTYTPNANFFGSDSFSYHAVDSNGAASNVATVTITVNEINDVPAATDDTATTNEDTPVSGNVLSNDTDIDNSDGILGNEDTHTAVLDAGPSNGSLLLNTDGSFTYTPNANFFGSDSFSYHAVDSDGAASNVATVTITVNEINDAPVATDDTATTNEDTPVSGNVLSNDTDIDNSDGILGNEDTHTAVLDAGPSNGSLLLNTDGSFTYTPNANFFGTDSFNYHAVDSDVAASNVATVTMTVTSVNDVPVANGEAYEINENNPLEVTAPGLLGNDSDVDGDTLQPVIVVAPAHGSLSVSPDGSFVYLPDSFYAGSDTFSYQAWDGQDVSNPTVVTITIIAVRPSEVSVIPDPGDVDNSNDDNLQPPPMSDISVVSLSSWTPTNGNAGQLASRSMNGIGDQAEHRFMPLDVSLLTAPNAISADRGGSRFFGPGMGRPLVDVDLVPIEVAIVESPTSSAGVFNLGKGWFWDQLDSQREKNQQTLDGNSLVVGTTVTVVSAFSVGYVVWTLRSGYLLTSFLATLPAWRAFDPLPVLQAFAASNEDDDEDLPQEMSLSSFVAQRSKAAATDLAGSVPNESQRGGTRRS